MGTPFVITRGRRRWMVVEAAEKLRLRAALPGAHVYDATARGLAEARAAGVPALSLLPAAMPASWMVNNASESATFREWLRPELRGAWADLLELTAGTTRDWLQRSAAERARVNAAVGAVSGDGVGAGAISKVVALLSGGVVPLMPDAVISFVLGRPPPEERDAQTHGVEVFVPVLDWFAHACASAETALIALAEEGAGMRLRPAQILDRILWFESIGYQHFRQGGREGFHWVDDGEHQAIVRIDATWPRATRGAAEPIAIAQGGVGLRALVAAPDAGP